MSTPQRVIDQETGISYRLTKYISAGATAAVYEAEPESAGGAPIGRTSFTPGLQAQQGDNVAVKYALNASWREHFEAERHRLNQIWQASLKHYCVRASKGVAENDPDLPVIIMELLPHRWEIFNQRPNGYLDEDTGLQLAEQYAELLDILHSKLGLTCGDRKGGDLYWDPDKRRLIVIDWNVATPRPAQGADSAAQARDLALVRADIAIFGRILYELLVGYPPKEAVDVDESNGNGDDRWRKLTRGTRYLLARMVSSQQSRRFDNARELLQAVREYYKAFTTSEGLSLIAEAQKRQQQLMAGSESLEVRQQIANLVDLALLRPLSPEQRSAAEKLRQWALDQEQAAASLISKTITEARQNIEGGYSQVAIDALVSLRTHEMLGAAYSLEAERWLLVARALNEGTLRHVQMKDVRPKLVSMLDALNNMQFDQAEGSLGSALAMQELAQLPIARGYLAQLEAELVFRKQSELARQFAAQAERLEGNATRAHWQRASDAYEKARNALKELAVEPNYREALLTQFPNFEAEADKTIATFKELEERLQSAQKATGLQEQVLNALSVHVNRPGDQASWPMDLRTILSDPTSLQQPRLTRLKQVDDLINSAQLGMALDAASLLAQEHNDWPPAQFAFQLCLRMAVRHFQSLAKAARAPRQVREALQLGQKVQLLDGTLRGTLQQDVSLLKEKDDLHKRIADLLGNPINLLARPGDAEIDKVLREAQEHNLELLDGPAPGGARCTADYVLGLRSSNHTYRAVQELLEKIDALGRDIQDRSNSLNQANEKLRIVQDSYASLQTQLSGLGLDSARLRELSASVDGLESIISKIDSVHQGLGTLPERRKEFEQLEGQLQAFGKKVDDIEVTLSSIENKFRAANKKSTDLLAAPEILNKLTDNVADKVFQRLLSSAQRPQDGELPEAIKHILDSIMKDDLKRAEEYEIQLMAIDHPDYLGEFKKQLDHWLGDTFLNPQFRDKYWVWADKFQKRNYMLAETDKLANSYTNILYTFRSVANDTRLTKLLDDTQALTKALADDDIPAPYWRPLADVVSRFSIEYDNSSWRLSSVGGLLRTVAQSLNAMASNDMHVPSPMKAYNSPINSQSS
jgi:hypothetical protein